jgi:hypothetical protein
VIGRHIDAETLARYGEGDLSSRQAELVRSHLASCSRCAAVLQDLASVPALLASTGVPPMPDHLTDRIQAALAAESAARSAHLTGEPDESGATPELARPIPLRPADGSARNSQSPGNQRRSARHRPARDARRGTWLTPRATGWAAAAAVVVAAAVGGGAYALTGSGGGTGTTAGEAPHTQKTHVGSPNIKAGPSGQAGISTTPNIRTVGPQLRYGRAGHFATVTPVTSGTRFAAATLAAQAQAVLAQYRLAVPAPSANGPGSSTSTGSFPDLAACVTRVAGSQRIQLVDLATYRNAPAAIIVAAPQAGRAQVWVVGTGCSADRADVLQRTTIAAGH